MTKKAKKDFKIEGRASTIFRIVKRTNAYAVIDTRPLVDPKFSFKAKGIFSYLMTRPDGWEVNVPDLVAHGTDGAAAIRTGLMELRDAGHVRYNTHRRGGYITKWVIEVYEDAGMNPDRKKNAKVLDDENREVEKVLDSDFLLVENRRELSIKSLNSIKDLKGAPAPDGDSEKKKIQELWINRHMFEKKFAVFLPILDWFVDVSQLYPEAKADITDLYSTLKTIGEKKITLEDLQAAWDMSQEDDGGFSVTRLGSLVRTAAMVKAERMREEKDKQQRQSTHSGKTVKNPYAKEQYGGE